MLFYTKTQGRKHSVQSAVAYGDLEGSVSQKRDWQIERAPTCLSLSSDQLTIQEQQTSLPVVHLENYLQSKTHLDLQKKARNVEFKQAILACILQEEIHQLQPVRRETYTTPGMKGRDLAARRFGKVKTDTIKSLITFHWTTFMSASPGKLSNKDPQSASRPQHRQTDLHPASVVTGDLPS